MANGKYLIESKKSFSESLIWQMNRDYYAREGIDAWREEVVPYHVTSNSMVGKTYAELIFAFLRDLAAKDQIKEKIYILELGAGHGKLAFHTLKHLDQLVNEIQIDLPPFCYVLSDVVNENLAFFGQHPQFQIYYEKGYLDLAFFDAEASKEIHLQHSGVTIAPYSLSQPLLVIANYFFDSIPNDLFHVEDKIISDCSVSLEIDEDPEKMDAATLLKNVQVSFHEVPLQSTFYQEDDFNEILDMYRDLRMHSYLLFPHIGLHCINNLNQLSQKGMMVISMDKGFHKIHDLENAKEPEMITHGSMSFWVNYHAYSLYCEKKGGKALFPSYSTNHMELGCLLFLPDSGSYTETLSAYRRCVSDFGPDDFNGIKKFTYRHLDKMSILELINMLRLGAYDSSFFLNVLPHLKQIAQQITFNERRCLAETMHKTWNMYFTLNESNDLSFEIAGMFYLLGFYEEALQYFQYSSNLYGDKADVEYNRALCYYQLREDALFLKTLEKGKAAFPAFEKFAHLDTLDLSAV
jgi:tetratricopeptide (TPR) repeat protein